MYQSLFPNRRSQITKAANDVVDLESDESLDDILRIYLVAKVIPAAQSYLAAVTAHRTARTTLTLAYRTTASANQDADDALRMLDAIAKNRRGDEIGALLRTLRDGKPMGALIGLPNDEQPAAVQAFLERIDGLGARVAVPREQVEAVRRTNEVMSAAVKGEERARKARTTASADVTAAEGVFLNVYRPFIELTISELGEAGAVALLPTFVHTARSAADDEDEDEEGNENPDGNADGNDAEANSQANNGTVVGAASTGAAAVEPLGLATGAAAVEPVGPASDAAGGSAGARNP